jgi:hypothetical protein
MSLATTVIFQIFNKDGSLLTIGQCDYDHTDRIEPKVKAACDKKGLTYKITLPHTPYSLVKFLETY